MSTFDDFMIGEATKRGDEIRKLEEQNARLRADLALLERAGCRVREGKDGHRFVEIVSDVSERFSS